MQRASHFFSFGWQRRSNWHKRSFHVQLCNCLFHQMFKILFCSWSEEDVRKNIFHFLKQQPVTTHPELPQLPEGRNYRGLSQFQGTKKSQKTIFLIRGSPQLSRCPGWRKSICWSCQRAGTTEVCNAPSQCYISGAPYLETVHFSRERHKRQVLQPLTWRLNSWATPGAINLISIPVHTPAISSAGMALSGQVIAMLVTLRNKLSHSHLSLEVGASACKSYFLLMLTSGLFYSCGEKTDWWIFLF